MTNTNLIDNNHSIINDVLANSIVQSKPKLPKPAHIAQKVRDKYRNKLAWNLESKAWYSYKEGIWKSEANESIQSVIQAELDNDNATSDNYSSSYVKDIIELVKGYLITNQWNKQLNLLPLKNGVLDLENKTLLNHSPGYQLTWCLPYEYNPTNTCEPIQKWLLEAMGGNQQLVELLRAYLNAVVKGRVDLQRYLELIGAGGTGKSTYIKLAMELIGVENTHTTTLSKLQNNRFETASIYGKKLVIITDSEHYTGNVSVLKALTGEDHLPYERKGEQSTRGFLPTAMVILAANEVIQSSDYTSGLARRTLTVPFNHQVLPEQRRDLTTEFKPYLSGLLNWVLDISDEQVTELVKNTERSVPSLKVLKNQNLCEINPMAEWLDLYIVHFPDAKTYIGNLDKSSDSHLYPNYSNHCRRTATRAVSMKRFSGLLEDLCRNQLRLDGVKKLKDRNGAFLTGLRLRTPKDTLPSPVTGQAFSDDTAIAETLTSEECDGCDGLIDVPF